MVINSNDNKPPEPALIGKKSTPAQLLFQKAQCPGSILFMPLLGSRYFSFLLQCYQLEILCFCSIPIHIIIPPCVLFLILFLRYRNIDRS